MNQVNHQLTSREGINTHRFEPVTHNELMLISGGGIIDKIKAAARWIKNHVFVDGKNKVAGVKGKF